MGYLCQGDGTDQLPYRNQVSHMSVSFSYPVCFVMNFICHFSDWTFHFGYMLGQRPSSDVGVRATACSFSGGLIGRASWSPWKFCSVRVHLFQESNCRAVGLVLRYIQALISFYWSGLVGFDHFVRSCLLRLLGKCSLIFVFIFLFRPFFSSWCLQLMLGMASLFMCVPRE